jgi:polynucleotide 5'-hydroxyl-kinase GRC3/NOL9
MVKKRKSNKDSELNNDNVFSFPFSPSYVLEQTQPIELISSKKKKTKQDLEKKSKKIDSNSNNNSNCNNNNNNNNNKIISLNKTKQVLDINKNKNNKSKVKIKDKPLISDKIKSKKANGDDLKLTKQQEKKNYKEIKLENINEHNQSPRFSPFYDNDILNQQDIIFALYSLIDVHSVIICLSSTSQEKINAACTRYASGNCNITLLKGTANINGYSLTLGTRTKLNNPIWIPAARLHLNGPSKKTQVKMINLLKKLECFDKFSNYFDINSTEPSSVSNCVCALLIEGIPYEQQEWLVAAEDQTKYLPIEPNSSIYISAKTAVISTSALLLKKGIDSIHLSPTWASGAEGCVDNISEQTSPRVIVCGAKGVGKSTCLRYTINRLLSKVGVVCLIDCDIGQPEIGPPGLASLHIIRSPLLSPPHLNMQHSHVSFFLGDLTTKNEPDIFFQILRELNKKYEELRDEYLISGDNSNNKDLSNIYDVLFNSNSSSCPLPLVVNTDGFIRYIGVEILTAIVDIFNPTNVLHISTEKDKNLSAIDNIITNEAHRSHLTCKIHTLEPGKLIPSKVAAVDLRTLRLISYFLRNDQKLKRNLDLDITNNNLLFGCVYIRNGCLVDNSGEIAISLMRNYPFVVPFNSISIRTLSTGIPSRLLLAAVNASLVGIVSSNGAVLPLSLDANQITTTPSFVHTQSQTIFNLDCEGSYNVTAPCLGLGIVRSVDIDDQNILILSPINPSKLPKFDKTCLVTSNIALPNTMIYSPYYPCYTHLSGESNGEGSAFVKVRNNLKRRSQNN